MAQSRAESTRDTYNYGQYLNQFPPNTIKVIRKFERIQKKICRHKMSIMFNEICINEEMLPKYTYIYIYRERERILSPVKPELGVIPSGQENIREYLDLPGKELNVSIIQSNIFIKKKTTKPITKDYKFISILLRIFEIFKNTKKN